MGGNSSKVEVVKKANSAPVFVRRNIPPKGRTSGATSIPIYRRQFGRNIFCGTISDFFSDE
jgi:hypothetical protein